MLASLIKEDYTVGKKQRESGGRENLGWDFQGGIFCICLFHLLILPPFSLTPKCDRVGRKTQEITVCEAIKKLV